MFKRVEQWLRRIVWEETQEASKHFTKLSTDRTDDLVRLILDLHEKKWSFKTDNFLRELNIDPTPYWEKYGVFRDKNVPVNQPGKPTVIHKVK